MLTQTKEGYSFRKGVPFKWSKSKPICGISVVKREIAVVFTTAISIFGGLEGDRTLDLCDANEPTGIVCTWIWPVLAVSANNHFVFKPLVTTIFRVFREPMWYVLWSASEPRWNAPARLVCCLRVDATSERGVRQQFSAHSNARGAMLNQGIGRVLPCCGSSRKINSVNKIKNLKTGRIIDKLALLC